MFIRKISADDDAQLAFIIRHCLEKFNAVKPGTVYFDEPTDHLYEVFQVERSAYFVVEIDGGVCGGAGIFPTNGLPPQTCELVKMYLSPGARGKGIGKLLLQRCILEAKNSGFGKMYLESMPELVSALPCIKNPGSHLLQSLLATVAIRAAMCL